MKLPFEIKTLEVDGVQHFLILPTKYRPDLAAPLYQFPSCRWSYKHKGWIIKKTVESEAFLSSALVPEAEGSITEQPKQQEKNEDRGSNKGRKSEVEPLSKDILSELLSVEELMRLRRYSWTTIKSYLSHLRSFFITCQVEHPKAATVMDLRRAVVDMVLSRELGSSSQVQLLSAIRFWWEQVLEREKLALQLQPRKEKKLPQVLSQDEVKRLFAAVENLKHRLILMLIYSAGLRLNELCRLRKMDIHIERGEIFVCSGKGKKDRYTTLSDRVIPVLGLYLEKYDPIYWLFEGQSGGAYSGRSVQAILRKAVTKSGVNPLATVHTLRHSYATHLLEQGVSLRHIQTLLGHNSSKTTEIYTKVSNAERRKIRSPLDHL